MLSPLVFFIGIFLSRKMRSGSLEELLYVDDLALVSESLEGLKGKLD